MEMGLFGHVPSAEEIEAKAFITTQEPWRDQWSWPAYIAGLADAGVGDERVCRLLSAACKGEFGLADLEDTMAWAMERCRQKNEDRGRYPR